MSSATSSSEQRSRLSLAGVEIVQRLGPDHSQLEVGPASPLEDHEVRAVETCRRDDQSFSPEHGISELSSIYSGQGRQAEDEKRHLSQIINVVNERFGMQLGTADQLFFDQREETGVADEALVAQARANDLANFRLPFTDVFLKTIVGRMDDNADIFKRILDEPAFQATVLEHYLQRVFERARSDAP